MAAPGRSADEEISAELGVTPDRDGDTVRWWLRGADAATHERATSLGLLEVRRLHQMRRPLPVDHDLGEPVPTRPFDPERDVEGWLDVNNRAFDFHPDQGGWTAATLRARMAEPWFDLDDFRVHDGPDWDDPTGAATRLDGFCWTKLHPVGSISDTDHAVGEIYVIAAAPERHGTGLGRALVLAGLDHLWRRHATPVGMLYVEADNAPALRLYLRLGFEVHLDDVAYERSGSA